MTGSVSIEGKPVTAGSVYVVLEENKEITAGGMIKGDGTYSVKAPVGKVKVAIQTLAFKPGGANEERKATNVSTAPNKNGKTGPPAGYTKEGYVKKGTNVPPAPAWANGDPEHPPKYVKIPGKYEKIESSGLAYEIHRGANAIDISLSEK
ncbi:hypothetical protein KIH39_14410 [Telmatocola sphagniphila]|uniref:Uncharacterized protein n=1 Tax=Telmatocola sphagniphila TaxID=1123043 RepID=A0A8E6ETK1_9BACT|nr:hypothetical protein [Telmatocola sphagniphila]QVL30052.1 hypothetical protein KIH39_14410 [Telmatocola sphagniphila]